MDRANKFTEIYKNNSFQGTESISGPGSSLVTTETLRQELPKLLKDLGVKTLIDCPCGDFHWMSKVINNLGIDKYIGIDIVQSLVDKNNVKYSNDLISFICKDAVEGLNFKGDLILCRDCLGHLSFNSVFKFFNNFINSDITYLLVTTFTNEDRYNSNSEDGVGSYAINLTKSPFNLPNPIFVLNENCPEGNGLFKDKSLGLWRRKDLLKYVAS